MLSYYSFYLFLVVSNKIIIRRLFTLSYCYSISTLIARYYMIKVLVRAAVNFALDTYKLLLTLYPLSFLLYLYTIFSYYTSISNLLPYLTMLETSIKAQRIISALYKPISKNLYIVCIIRFSETSIRGTLDRYIMLANSKLRQGYKKDSIQYSKYFIYIRENLKYLKVYINTISSP